MLGAAWDSARASWTVDNERTEGADADPGPRVQISASWLFCGGGYYRYDQGYTPKFDGTDRFTGRIVHPQHWPEDLDYAGKKVVVIGSGATAAPADPGDGGHGCPRHHAAALPDVRDAGAGQGLLRQHRKATARRRARLRAGPAQEHLKQRAV